MLVIGDVESGAGMVPEYMINGVTVNPTAPFSFNAPEIGRF